MGETVRADDALLTAVRRGDGEVLHTTAGTTVSWTAVHVLAEHGFRWAPEDVGSPAAATPGVTAGGDGTPAGARGRRLHVDLTVEHPAEPGILLGTAPSLFVEHAFDLGACLALTEGGQTS